MSRFIFWTSTLLALAFLVIPLVLIMPLAFNESSFLTYPMEGFSLKWFHEVFAQEQWARSFLNSLKVAVGTTVVALLVGGLAATGVMLLNRWLQTILTALFVSPMIVPSIVIGVAFA
jgi:putative spermidine/putrescine transport system permease protein